MRCYEKNENLKEYEEFCARHGSFTQSVNWGLVKDGWLTEYVTVRNVHGEIKGVTLVLVKKIPVLKTALLYAPRGFVCNLHDRQTAAEIFEQIRLIADKYHAFTLKTDPMIDENDLLSIKTLVDLGFDYHGEKRGYDNIQCRENYVLDVKGKTYDEVFAGFKPKWRYNIRLAQRRGVKCGFYGEEHLDDFMRLMRQTGERDGFQIRSKEYFGRVLRAFGGGAALCMCYKDGKALSGALMIRYGKTVSYVYGCSSNEDRQFMPNYLMQWSMIKYAVKSGCDTYDFCGVPYWYDESHKNYGVYRFKRGFGGGVKTYAGEFDYTFRRGVDCLAHMAARVLGVKA